MKIRTYFAKDMRAALRQVREDQGPDAVILSTRAVPGGVEVAAAIDAAEFARLPPTAAAPPAVDPQANSTVDAGAAAIVAPTSDATAPAQFGAELRSMRHLLETQMAQLAWNDLTRRAPAQAELLKELTELGLAAELATELVNTLPADLDYAESQRRCLAVIARRIAVTGDALLDSGGRVAFVGPTGVGKTTAIAKLAARWVMRHGARDIALVSVDGQRFGAQEQLRVLGRLLGVEAYSLEDVAGLPDLLARLPDHRLVLIDTAGISPRDAQLTARAEQLNAAASRAGITVCLALSAGAQAGVLQEAVARFRVFRPATCLITKLDEAASLGGTLSTLIAASLPVSYVSEGQRIPEDLSPARAHQLVSRAVQLARIAGATAGEDLLTRRFGGVAHDIA
ncbi:MAG: flagellar biosynthesis protein FlhF [Pseudomonadota bacterium]